MSAVSIPFKVFLGNTESQQYTVAAPNLKALKKKLGEMFASLNGRWYTQTVAPGYPSGSMRFRVTATVHGFKTRSPVLIIPPRPTE